MKISLKRTSPNYRQPLSTQRIMRDLTAAILVLCVAAVAYNFTRGSEYGIHAIVMIAVSVITALVTEVVWAKVNGKTDIKTAVLNSFPLVTALLFALTLPIGTPYYVVAVGSFIGIFFGKLIYGGFGSNIFNPALVGRVVVHLSFGAQLTTYLGTADAATSASPLTALAGTNFLGELNVGLGTLFAGTHPGAIGETFTILILALGVFLAIRKVIDVRITGSIIVTTLILGLIQGITGGLNPITTALAHLALGGMALGAVFMATDPVTSPTSPLGKVIYGILVAFVAMLIRVKANYPEGVLFAILIMNMFTPMIDNFTLGRTNVNTTKQYITIGAILAIACGTMFGIGSSLEPVKPKEDKPVVEEKTYELVSKSGTDYVVSSKGFGGDIEVEVTFDGDTITSVNVTKHNETVDYGKDLIETGAGMELTANAQTFHDTIIKGTEITKDTLDGVDTSTGATKTAQGIVNALKGALEERAKDPIVSAQGNTYVVRANGFGGENKLHVEVVMDKANQTVTSVKVVEYAGETAGYGKDLIEVGTGGELNPNAQAFHDKVLNGSFAYTDVATIDTATGATKTAKGILDGVQTAIDAYAEVLEKSPNGVYTLQTVGFYPNDPISLEIKINGSTVEYVKVLAHGESSGFGKDLIEVGTGGELNPNGQTFHDTVLGGSFEIDAISGIDTSTGATKTADGIMSAVNKAVAADQQ